MGSPYKMRLLTKQLLLFAFIGISLAVPLSKSLDNKNAKKIFNSIDANDGYISTDETMNLVNSIIPDFQAVLRLFLERSIVRKFDTDHDDKLNFAEFLKGPFLKINSSLPDSSKLSDFLKFLGNLRYVSKI